MNSSGSNSLDPTNGGGGSSYSVNSKIMIVAIVVLFGVVFFILGLHVYAKWFWRQGNGPVVSWRRRRRLEFAFAGQARVEQAGLDDSVKESLPVFVFDSTKTAADGMECAVCLEEFSEGEKGRMLPKCDHSFHIDCIDMWFQSNSTCPLCRCSVAPDPPSDQELSILAQPRPLTREDPHALGFQTTPFSGRSHLLLEDSPPHSVMNFHHGDQQPVRAVADGTSARVIPENSSAAVPTSMSITELSSSQRDAPGPDLSPKTPPVVQYPSNVLFWGNQSQVNVGYGVSREESVTRQISEAGINAPSCLVIEIPRISAAAAFAPVASGDKSGDSKSPVGRIMSSSFRRLMSLRRGATVSPEVDDSPTAVLSTAACGSELEAGMGGPGTVLSINEGSQRRISVEQQS